MLENTSPKWLQIYCKSIQELRSDIKHKTYRYLTNNSSQIIYEWKCKVQLYSPEKTKQKQRNGDETWVHGQNVVSKVMIVTGVSALQILHGKIMPNIVIAIPICFYYSPLMERNWMRSQISQFPMVFIYWINSKTSSVV